MKYSKMCNLHNTKIEGRLCDPLETNVIVLKLLKWSFSALFHTRHSIWGPTMVQHNSILFTGMVSLQPVRNLTNLKKPGQRIHEMAGRSTRWAWLGSLMYIQEYKSHMQTNWDLKLLSKPDWEAFVNSLISFKALLAGQSNWRKQTFTFILNTGLLDNIKRLDIF